MGRAGNYHAVRAFVSANESRLSPLSRREALKHLGNGSSKGKPQSIQL